MANLNPTAKQDLANSLLPLDEQFPDSLPQVRTCDTDPLEYDCGYPGDLDTNYTVYRCSLHKYPTLQSAQRFFGTLRNRFNWRSESAIFRTARFWCKRAIGAKNENA